MVRRYIHAIVATASLLAPASAVAETPEIVPPIPALPNTFSLGGGAMGFLREHDVLTPVRAATWSLRYGFTPAAPLTWELAYVGAMDVSPPERGDREQLFATLIEAGMRINIVPIAQVYPFVAGGVGYGAFERRVPDQLGDLDLATVTLPLAGGIEALLDEASLQTRLEYRPVLLDESVHFTGRGADGWTWTVSVGARY